MRNVLRLVAARNAASLLDIGAGSPVTGCRLAQSVQRYLAIEENAGRAKMFEDAGLDVWCGKFPLSLSERFDIVLSSHSVPELTQATLGDYPPFIRSAWTCVAPGGTLLIVTFKGGAREVSELSSLVFADTAAPPRDTGSKEYHEIISILSEVGLPLVNRVRSHIVADSAEELLVFITPWINGSSRQMSEIQVARLRDAIESRYFVKSDLYVLPTEHLFISVERTRH